MDPGTLALIGIGGSAASGLFGGIGAAGSAHAQAAMYNYQAAIAAQNEQIDKQNAQYSLLQGEAQAGVSGMRTRAQIGQIRTAQAASGFQLGVGTQPLVPAGQHTIGAMEQATIRGNAYKQAYDFDIGALQAKEQASADTAAGQNVMAAMPLNVASSVLGGATSVAGKWFQMGAFTPPTSTDAVTGSANIGSGWNLDTGTVGALG